MEMNNMEQESFKSALNRVLASAVSTVNGDEKIYRWLKLNRKK